MQMGEWQMMIPDQQSFVAEMQVVQKVCACKSH
ncbi:hypothetical protein SAMN05421740_102207 [Parapedobacter koreensis]|uniref:Uncharacterized protein n=1 Tax=Parapedobacter koreensis TaxID=332977 RepID=A0A1H7IDZ5_9SPHI|nr:hypothetical protein SAMN05421740_102207 [Parapedobacter koreensis]